MRIRFEIEVEAPYDATGVQTILANRCRAAAVEYLTDDNGHSWARVRYDLDATGLFPLLDAMFP